MSEVPIHVGLKPRWKGENPRSFLQVSCKPLLTFASRCEDATVELCNTKALRLLRSRKRPENGAPGSLQRNGRPLKDGDRQLLESVTGVTAVDTLTLAMEAVDAAGLFFPNADREIERFWRGLRRASETSSRAYPLSKKKLRRRHVLSNFIRRELWLDNLSRAHPAPDTEITK